MPRDLIFERDKMIERLAAVGCGARAIRDALREEGLPPLTHRALAARLAGLREAARQRRQDAARWPGMNDTAIRAAELDQLDAIGRLLTARGATLLGHSPVSEAVYYRLPDGRRVRVACHALPPTDERLAAAETSREVHLTITRHRDPAALAEWVAEELRE